MQLICPSCHTEHHVDAYAGQLEQADFLRALLDVPYGLSTRVMRYLAVFKPPSRKLAAWRAADLTRELIALMESKEHNVSPHDWLSAFGTMQDLMSAGALTNLPMKNHNYLIKVAIAASKDIGAITRPRSSAPKSKLQSQVDQAVEDLCNLD